MLLPKAPIHLAVVVSVRPGVPEPQQDLQSHKDSFKLQGFNETEMIALVACGHTKGNNPTVASFDSTIKYDNAVVAEYLSGTTKYPLVVNVNTTMLSDLRIFLSDGNATMKRMQSPTDFANTCQTLLERMLNTVPADVQLTDEIILLPFKVKTAELIVNGSDILFNVVARVALPGVTNFTRSAESVPSVKLFWCDRRGSNADCADGKASFADSVGSLFPGATSPLTDALNTSFQAYQFHAPIVPGPSVGKFWFGVLDAGKGVKDTVLQGNGGQGYLISQDVIVSVPALSSAVVSSFSLTGITQSFGMVIGVKSNSTPTLAEMRIFDNNIAVSPGGNVAIPPPLNFTTNLKPLEHTAVGGYNFYEGKFSDDIGQPTVDIAIEVDGRRYELDFVKPRLRFALGDGSDGQFSKVGKVDLTEALFGGQVNTAVGSSGNGTEVVAPSDDGGGGGGSGASKTYLTKSGSKLLAGLLMAFVGMSIPL